MNGATDEEVPKMSDEERTKLYKLSQDSATSTIRSAITQITLELHDEHGLLLVRAVLKGEERFVNFVNRHRATRAWTHRRLDIGSLSPAEVAFYALIMGWQRCPRGRRAMKIRLYGRINLHHREQMQ
jgi:hypothetical protein